MADKAEVKNDETTITTNRRYWCRRESPSPWMPWGLLPLIGLAVSFLFGTVFMAPRIEADVRSRVADRFGGAGVATTEVSANGQIIAVHAAATDFDEIFLQALAGSTKCDTWAGQLTCPTTVDVSVEALARPPQESSGPGSAMIEPVNDATTYEPQQCNQSFSEMLAGSGIQFATGSAVIHDSNGPLIEELAELAKSCPARLTVAGHTDNRGDAAMNKSLSLARATAVRDALVAWGVDADRVTAAGFGEEQPLAENTTTEGRARNRRIVIVVDEAN